MWGIAPPFRACGPSAIYLHARAFSGTGSVRSRCYPEPTLRFILLIHLVWASSTQLGNGRSSLLLRRGRHRFGVEAVSYRRRAVTAGGGGGRSPPKATPPYFVRSLCFLSCTTVLARLDYGSSSGYGSPLTCVYGVVLPVVVSWLGLESGDPPPGSSFFPRSVFAFTLALG